MICERIEIGNIFLEVMKMTEELQEFIETNRDAREFRLRSSSSSSPSSYFLETTMGFIGLTELPIWTLVFSMTTVWVDCVVVDWEIFVIPKARSESTALLEELFDIFVRVTGIGIYHRRNLSSFYLRRTSCDNWCKRFYFFDFKSCIFDPIW